MKQLKSQVRPAIETEMQSWHIREMLEVGETETGKCTCCGWDAELHLDHISNPFAAENNCCKGCWEYHLEMADKRALAAKVAAALS